MKRWHASLCLRLLSAGALSLLTVFWALVPAAADALDGETRQIAQLLRCPICQSVSVADSQSDLAQQMRNVIRDQLSQGRTKEEILAYFVERYGESVLLDPPKQGFGLIVWVVPMIVLLAGAVVVWRTLREAGSRSGATVPADDHVFARASGGGSRSRETGR